MNDSNSLQNIVFTAKSNNLITIARLPSINNYYISQIIDTGVDGILYPHIEEISQLEFVISQTFFPNEKRIFPFTPKYNYSQTKNLNIEEPS